MRALIGGALLLAATVSTAEAQCYVDTIERDPMGHAYWACRAREEQQQQQMQQEIERHNREQIMRDQLEEQRRQNRMRQDEEMQREIFRKR